MNDFDVLIKKYEKLKADSNSDIDEILKVLCEISEISYDEKLMYEWVLWYWKAGYPARAKRVCKKMITFFRDGEWVEKTRKVYDMLQEDVDFLPEYESELKMGSDPEENPKPVYVTDSAHSKETGDITETDDDIPPVIREAFKDMVGMDSVKKELIGFYNIAKFEKLREQQLGFEKNKSRSYNFVLYGNPGTGKTTVARIIGKVLYALGIRENDKFMEVDRSDLVSEYIGQTAKNVKKKLEEIRGGTLFIDEAYELFRKGDEKDFGNEAISALLKDMEDNRSEYSVIIAGYHAQMTEMLNHSNPGFRSRFTYHIHIPDYSEDELMKIADKVASSHHYTIDEAGYTALKKRIDRERIDETFGNARFIREVINEAEKNLATRLKDKKGITLSDMTTLTAEDIFPEEDKGESLDELLNELNSLIGLTDVKKTVAEMIDTIRVQKEIEKRGLKVNTGHGTLHMSFKGNAGTGKTTVARLLGKIFAELGVLKRSDVFVEVGRVNLVGQYLGHTAQIVKEVVRSAMGGILFIDEAYALNSGDNDTFGKEAIDTLVAELENHRDSFCVILAGYTDDIDRFLETNQGLQSRICRHLIFEDYTLDEMVEIFKLQVKKAGYILSEGIEPAVKTRLENEYMSVPNFGNGRGVRNVFEEICRKKNSKIAKQISEGIYLSNEDIITINKEDLL